MQRKDFLRSIVKNFYTHSTVVPDKYLENRSCPCSKKKSRTDTSYSFIGVLIVLSDPANL